MKRRIVSVGIVYITIILLYCYLYFRRETVNIVKEKRFQQIQKFIDDCMIKHKEYFAKNECIKTSYSFVKRLLTI